MTNSTSAFSVDEVLKASMAMAKKNWIKYLMLIGVVILMYLAYGVVAYVLFSVINLPKILDTLAQIILAVYGSIFMVRGALAIAREQKLDIAELLKLDAKTFLHALGASILFYIVTVIGFILLIIPGIIASIMFGYYIYSIVDKKAEFIQSLEDSMNMTRGNKMKIFLYQLLIGLIAMLAIGIPSIIITVITFSAMEGTQMAPMLVMILAGLALAVVVIPVSIYLSMVSMSGQAYMYLKMRAKTPLHLSK